MADADELRSMLSPRSVVVHGVSKDADHPSRKLMRNLTSAGFRGPVRLVGQAREEEQRVMGGLQDLDILPEMAILCQACHRVPEAARECFELGIPNVVILSGGFAETGSEGHFAQSRMVAQARAARSRILGPNSAGVWRLFTGLNATLNLDSKQFGSSDPTLKSGVTLLSSSGGLARMTMGALAEREVPTGTMIGLGNCADLGPSDWLEALAYDPQTAAVGFLFEGGGDGGRAWLDAAIRLSRQKPLVVLRMGMTEAGQRAMQRHTALPSTDIRLADLLGQAGLSVARSMSDLVNRLEVHWKMKERLPLGPNVAVITNSGGAAVLAADRLTEVGLNVPLLEPNVMGRLGRCVPPHGAFENPVDVTPEFKSYAGPELLDAVMTSTQVASALIILVGQDLPDWAETVARISNSTGRPAVFVIEACPETEAACHRLGLPVVSKLETGVAMLAELHHRVQALDEVAATPPTGLRRPSRVLEQEFGLVGSAAPLKNLMLGSRTFGSNPSRREARPTPPPEPAPAQTHVLADEVCRKVLKEYGFPLLDETLLRSLDELDFYAREHGYPLIVQLRPSKQTLRMANPEQRMRVVSELDPEHLRGQMLYLLEPRPRGDRLLVAGHNHPDYGPLMSLRNYRTIIWRLCPSSRAVLAQTLEELGLEPNNHALETLEKISGLLNANPSISRMELNPLVVNNSGATVAGYHMTVTR